MKKFLNGNHLIPIHLTRNLSVVFRVIDLIPNPDIRKLISEILKIQTDIDLAEREGQKVESRLTDIEADFKILIKRNLGGTPGKSQGLRSDIEVLRNQLNNISSQKSKVVM